MSSPSSTPKPWIESPLWDGLWILNGLWLMALVFLLSPYQLGGAFSWFVTEQGRSLFSSAHLLAPILSVYGLFEFRQVILKEKFRFIWLPLLLLVVPVAVIFADAVTGWSSYSYFPNYNPIKILVVIFLVWNYWHFASHNFGVLSLYRIRVKQFTSLDRKVDRVFTSLTMLVLVPLIWYGNAISKPERSLFEFLPKAEIVLEWREFIMALGIVFTMAVLLFEWRKPNRSIPKMLYISVIGAQTSIVAFSYPVFYFLLINLNHWLSELALIGKIHAHRSTKEKPKLQFAFFILLFIGLGVLWDQSFLREGMWRFGNSLVLNETPLYLQDIDYVSALLMGFIFGLHFLHMLCDRYLFSFRRHETKEIVENIANKTLCSQVLKPTSCQIASRLN